MQTAPPGDGRSGVVLAAVVRTLGAFPSGWRVPGSHRDPARDAAALRRLAKEAERAHLDYLFFGDWLSNAAELEFTAPYLTARVDPLSAAGYLAAVTSRIGLVATVNSSYTDPFTMARTAASLDLLSAGRFGLGLAVGTEERADANHAPTAAGHPRHAVAAEYLEVLRRAWDSWADDGVRADAAAGALLAPGGPAPIGHRGAHFSVAGPALTLRPPQGHVPIVHADQSARGREFAAEHAEVLMAAPGSLAEGVEITRELRAAARRHGRDAAEVTVLAALQPLVAPTRPEAWRLYDQLVELLPVVAPDAPPGVPRERTAGAIRRLVGVPLLARELDDAVTPDDAERFNAAGARLLETVRRRSGRAPGGERRATYRHLLVAWQVPAPLVVGTPDDVADHVESWFRAGAADGFAVHSASLHEQFEAFTRTVVPLLVERGLFRAGYRGRTLRDHLGSARPERRRPEPAPDTETPPKAGAFDGVVFSN